MMSRLASPGPVLKRSKELSAKDLKEEKFISLIAPKTTLKG